MKSKLLLTLGSTLLALSLYGADSPAVGSAAPDFSVTDTAGKTRSLAEFKGKHVVLEWFNPECPFVKKHYGSGNMQKLQEEYTGKGVVWLSVDSSAAGLEGNLTADAANKIAASWKTHPTAMLLDADGKMGQAYGAKNTPHVFVISPDGKLIYEGAIDSNATPDPKDLATATNYVKEALDQSLSGKQVSIPSTRPYGCSVKYAH